MAGAFTGLAEGECAINVGVSGPGVVEYEIKKHPDYDITQICELIKLHKRRISADKIHAEVFSGTVERMRQLDEISARRVQNEALFDAMHRI